MAAEESFATLGKIEALSRLFQESGFSPAETVSFIPSNGSEVFTASKIYLEGVDFNLIYFPLKHLGHRSVTGVTGELLAHLSHPKILNVRLGISAKLDYTHIKDLWTGIYMAAKEYGYESVGLDLVPSRNGLTISMSASGETSLITRKRIPDAKSKDLICVSGSLGAAYLGMQVLEKESEKFNKPGSEQPDLSQYKMLIGSYLKPELESSIVSHLEDSEIYPSKGYFITRGLSDALKRLTLDTGLGAKVYAEKIPFEGNSFNVGKILDIDPVSAAMNGGEDYRLLFVVPILSLEKFRRDFQTFDIIGHMAQNNVGAVLVTPDGVELPVKAQGWNNE